MNMRIDVSGVRSSCEMWLTKSVLRREMRVSCQMRRAVMTTPVMSVARNSTSSTR